MISILEKSKKQKRFTHGNLFSKIKIFFEIQKKKKKKKKNIKEKTLLY
ncbi:hypothetical protein ACO2IA_13820 [Leptospira interrogans]